MLCVSRYDQNCKSPSLDETDGSNRKAEKEWRELKYIDQPPGTTDTLLPAVRWKAYLLSPAP